MTGTLQKRSGNSRQRGFWLRCFLGPIPIVVVLLLCAPATANANVCVSQTFSVSAIHGFVTDQNGEIIPKVRIMLQRSGNTVLESTTDDKGDFQLKASPGRYDLRVDAPGFMPSWAPLKVGFGPKSWFRSKTLYVALAVGLMGCAPDFTTSYKEYKRTLRVFEAGGGDHTKDKATQK